MAEAILTPEQKRALEIVSGDALVGKLFYLTGGTALAAYYLGHRYSDDLDFFTNESDFPQLAIEAVVTKIKTAIGAHETEYRRLHDRRIFFFKKSGEELKVEFTYYPFPQLNPPQRKEGVLIDSLEDIAANKLMALIDRIEAKDFVDLYFLITKGGFTLKRIAEFVKQKFDFTLDPITLGSELAKVRTLTQLPKVIAPLTLEALKMFFTEEAKKLRPEVIEG